MKKPDLILIAASAGGPKALKEIIGGINQSIDVPVLVVQHMMEGFTEGFANSVNNLSRLNVKAAKENEKLEKANVYIAPGGFHMELGFDSKKTPFVKLTDTPKVNYVKPAADVLFKNVAENYKGRNILVIVATGMGKDGMEGVKYLKEHCNCYCITESEKTCITYGMPRRVNEAGLSDEVLDLNLISSRINYICDKGWK